MYSLEEAYVPHDTIHKERRSARMLGGAMGVRVHTFDPEGMRPVRINCHMPEMQQSRFGVQNLMFWPEACFTNKHLTSGAYRYPGPSNRLMCIMLNSEICKDVHHPISIYGESTEPPVTFCIRAVVHSLWHAKSGQELCSTPLLVVHLVAVVHCLCVCVCVFVLLRTMQCLLILCQSMILLLRVIFRILPQSMIFILSSRLHVIEQLRAQGTASSLIQALTSSAFQVLPVVWPSSPCQTIKRHCFSLFFKSAKQRSFCVEFRSCLMAVREVYKR